MTDIKKLQKLAETILEGMVEIREAQAKTDEQLAKTDAQLAKTDEQLAETDAQLAKTDAQLAKTDAQLAKTDAQLAKTDAQLAKTDARLAKTDAMVEKLAKLYGNAANNQGAVCEEFFFNSLKAKPTLGGITYDFVGKNWSHDTPKVRDEFDIVMVNGKDIAIVEAKYKAHESDVVKLATKKLENFKNLYPMYADYNHRLVLASFHMNDKIKEEAQKKGVILLQRKGDVIETIFPATDGDRA